MRAVVQRVSSASVAVEGRPGGEIGLGLVAFLGVGMEDTAEDAKFIANKLAGLRCFSDESGKFNLSVRDVSGSILAISQFTLFGDCRRGTRPSFSSAARPEIAVPLYEECVARIREQGIHVATGEFGAHMTIDAVNDGPVTLLLDSEKTF